MKTNQAKQIALLGGSFDPPHQAHVQVLEYLLGLNRFEALWVIPAGQHPFKGTAADYGDRLKMCHLAFDSLGKSVKISEVERETSGFTIDIIRLLQKTHPDSHFTFVGGSDLQAELSKWKETEALQEALDFLFLPRPPDPGSPFADISSTLVRGRVKNRLPIAGLVPKAVEEYIQKKKLYL